jgi:hypothetical protein
MSWKEEEDEVVTKRKRKRWYDEWTAGRQEEEGESV